MIQNKKAFFDYHIEETLEVGIVLIGCEVKSIRDGHASIRESFVRIDAGEMWLMGCHIQPYKEGSYQNLDPLRNRKLLAKKSQIKRWMGKVKEKGFTIVVTKMFFKKQYVKVEIGLGRSKKQYDKRESIKKKAIQRDLRRAAKHSR